MGYKRGLPRVFFCGLRALLWFYVVCYSVPVAFIRGVAQPGRVLRSGRRSRRFEPSHPDQFKLVTLAILAMLVRTGMSEQ